MNLKKYLLNLSCLKKILLTVINLHSVRITLTRFIGAFSDLLFNSSKLTQA